MTAPTGGPTGWPISILNYINLRSGRYSGTSTTGQISTGTGSGDFNVVPGTFYTGQAMLAPVTISGVCVSPLFRMTIRWYNGASDLGTLGQSTVSTASGITALTYTEKAPLTATKGRLEISINASCTTVDYYVDLVAVTATNYAPTYFDGSFPNASWAGGQTGNAISSITAGPVIQIGAVSNTSVTQTINVGTNIGSGGVTNVTVGSAIGVGSTIIQGGTGSNALVLQTGNSGGIAGTIQIGNSTGPGQSIFVGNNSAASTTIQIGSTAGGITTIQSAGGVSVKLLTGSATSAICASANGGGQQLLYDCNPSASADFAERYPAAPGLEVGDVVSQGSTQVPTYDTDSEGNVDWNNVKGTVSQVVKATVPYSNSLIGVVSDNYTDFGSVGNNIKESDNPKSIALVGRVNVKVTNENGPIAPGDYLTASATIPGYAMKATSAGNVIGQALNSFNSSTGLVMVFVRGQHWSGPTMSGLIQNGDSATLTNLSLTGNLDITGNLNVSGATNLDTLTVTNSITTQTLVVNGSASFNGSLSVNGHILSANTSGTTTATPGPAACTAPTVTLSGNDTSGTITITTGSGCTNTGTLATVTFAHGYGGVPRVLLTQAETNAAKLRFYNGSSTSSTFTIDTNTIPTSSTTYKYSYFIIQ